MTAEKNTGGTEASKTTENTNVKIEAAVVQSKETEKISISVEAVENQADKILDEARIKSNDILLKAREEVNRIANSGLALTEVDFEKDKIIKSAKDAASRKLQASKTESSRIKSAMGGKEDSVVKQLIEMVTGAEAK